MFTKERKGTTGEAVSRLAVLAVLAQNEIRENHVDRKTRKGLLAEAQSIIDASEMVRVAPVEGVLAQAPKVLLRFMERSQFMARGWSVN